MVQLDPLQLRYTELCIEKRRMLNESKQVEVDAKELRSEIHRLLDCFMELVPVEEFLKDDDWRSDGQVDEFCAAEEAFSEYGFLGDTDEEQLIEQDQMMLEELPNRANRSPKRRRSKSPRRRSSIAQLANSGAPEYPIIVGRAMNRITIYSLGVLEQPPPLLAEDPATGYKWHPRGFESRRKYTDCVEYGSPTTPKRTNYICQIDPSGIFSITIEASRNELVKGDDPSEVWTRFVRLFPSPLCDVMKGEFSGLEAFFGLEHEATRRHLRQFAVL